MSLVEYTPRPPTSSFSVRNYPANPKRRFVVNNKSYNPDKGLPQINDKVSFNYLYNLYKNGIITAVNDGNTYDITDTDSKVTLNVPILRIKAPIQGGRRKTRQNRNKNRKSRRRHRK